MFNPKPRYTVNTMPVAIKDFVNFREEYVTRPPYQRKSVWDAKHQYELLDSLFRRYYVPRIVLREVRLDEDHTVWEVIDGQQRITTAQRFLENELTLPQSLSDLNPNLPGKKFSELPVDVRRFVDRSLVYDADIIAGIDDPTNPEHQNVATEIFWRLQQGETLNYMEVAHARLSSLSRNFVVHHADDIRFDYEAYKPVDTNPNKHPFFKIIRMGNNRMEHLALLTRFLLYEEGGGPADAQNKDVSRYIDRFQQEDGIGNFSFDKRPQARAVIGHLNAFHGVFKGDPIIKGGGVVQELGTEYFVVSVYLLLRHVRNLYVFGGAEGDLFRRFVLDFHARWKENSNRDTDVLQFREAGRQGGAMVLTRHMILRQLFFQFANKEGHQMQEKDSKRAFDESERILLYRMNDGMCQECVREEKPRQECLVPWSEFEADHVVPHSKGGQTLLDNADLLCRYHNRKKGASLTVGA